MASQNEFGNATEDFTHNHVVSNWFAEAALICDPIKVQWWNLHQLNECHPSLVKVPTMVVSICLNHVPVTTSSLNVNSLMSVS